MEPSSTSRTRLLGWVMMVVAAEAFCFVLLRIGLSTLEIWPWISVVVCFSVFLVLLIFAVSHLQKEYPDPDSPVTLFFINLVFGIALLSIWPVSLKAFSVMFSDMGQNLPSMTRLVLNIASPFWKWPILSVSSSFVYACPLFLLFSNNRLVSNQRYFQQIILLILSTTFLISWFSMYLPVTPSS